jgi:hypothetical protein
MELSFGSAPEPVNAVLAEPSAAPKSYAVDLFEACSVDAARAKAPAPCIIEAPPVAANDQLDSEALALAAIVDVLIEMWREASGEDLRPTIFPR